MTCRVLQAQNTMTGMTGFSLHRNNNLDRRILSLPLPPSVVGTPRRIVSYCRVARPGYTIDYGGVGGGDFDSIPPPYVLQGKYGTSPFTPVEGTRMREMKQPSFGASSDDDSEADNGQRNPWCSKQDDDTLYLKMDMPGVCKEDVKVYVEGGTHILMAKGIRKPDPDFEDDKDTSPGAYVYGFSLMSIHEYKVEGIKAEMKNGVLKVTIPKVKDEERMDVLHVQVN